jgi:hypothetical protein
MRTFFLFALTLAGTAAITDDASALGKRGRRAEQCCNGGGYAVAATPCCGQPAVAYGANIPVTYGQPAVAYNGVYGSECCGQTAMAPQARRGLLGRRHAGDSYAQSYNTPMYYPSGMSQGGVYQSGYYGPTNPAGGIVPAAATIDPRTGLPIAPRTVPAPMPDR